MLNVWVDENSLVPGFGLPFFVALNVHGIVDLGVG